MPPAPPTNDTTPPPGRLDALQGLALALPALALVLPTLDGQPPLALDPTPEASAAAWVALATLPALALAVLRGAAPRSPALFALLGAWLVAVLGLGTTPTELFGAERARLALSAAAALVTLGATLGLAGRAVYAAAAALAGLALVVTARVWPASLGLPGWTGAVGNTGDLSEAALPAGLLGLALFLVGPRWLRPFGLAAGLGHALYAGLVPVHAGTVAWLAATVAAFAFAGGRAVPRRLARLALLASFVAVVAAGGRIVFGRDRAAPDLGAGRPSATQADPVLSPLTPSAADRAELGGAPFRLATWRATAALVAAHPLGVGAGQFQAAFPRFRDQDELERSSRGRAEPTPQEVEHPHHDLLYAFAELGLLGGGLVLVFLGWVLLRAVTALRSGDGLLAGYGLAAVAVLVNGLFNAPLFGGTLSAALVWPLFGVLLAPRDAAAPGGAAAPRLAARLTPLLCLALTALQAGTALDFVAHGRALSGLGSARVTDQGRESLDPDRLEQVLARALAARPDSVVALEKRVELLAARGGAPGERRALLERILAARPDTFAARLALGNLEAADLDLEAARAHYEAAARVDARHPALLRNQLTLAQDRRDPEAVAAALAAARSAGLVSGAELEQRIAEQLLRGRLEVAEVLLATWSPERPAAPGVSPGAEPEPTPTYRATDANEAFRASKALREAGRELLAEGFLCAYQVLVSREHRRSGLSEQAVRMARQALRRAEAWPKLPGAHGALRLELAAALVSAGDEAGAREALAAGEIPAVDLARLPEPDREQLVAAGLVEIRAGRVVVPD